MILIGFLVVIVGLYNLIRGFPGMYLLSGSLYVYSRHQYVDFIIVYACKVLLLMVHRNGQSVEGNKMQELS